MEFLLILNEIDLERLEEAADAAGFDDLAEYIKFVITCHLDDAAARELARAWLEETRYVPTESGDGDYAL